MREGECVSEYMSGGELVRNEWVIELLIGYVSQSGSSLGEELRVLVSSRLVKGIVI